MQRKRELYRFTRKYYSSVFNISPNVLFNKIYTLFLDLPNFSIKNSSVYEEKTFYRKERKNKEHITFENFNEDIKYRITFAFYITTKIKSVSFEFKNIENAIDFISYFDNENNEILAYLLLTRAIIIQ